MTNIVKQGFAWWLLERKVRGKSYQQYQQMLQESSSFIQNQISRADENMKSRHALIHIIGLERWIQSRMMVALGSPFIQDESDRYLPPEDTSWIQLSQTFIDVRNDSIDLIAKIAAKDVDPTSKIDHNAVGPLSVRAWMEYVVDHGNKHAEQMTLRT